MSEQGLSESELNCLPVDTRAKLIRKFAKRKLAELDDTFEMIRLDDSAKRRLEAKYHEDVMGVKAPDADDDDAGRIIADDITVNITRPNGNGLATKVLAGTTGAVATAAGIGALAWALSDKPDVDATTVPPDATSTIRFIEDE